jgi:cell division protein FtsL
MTRLNLVLLLAVLASALYLVRTQYESRRLFAEIDRAASDARKLEIEHERLQVEKRAQATPLRVERLAKEQLHMRGASPAITQYVIMKGAATSPAVNLSAAGPPQGARTPSGGSAAASAASVGAFPAAGPPQGARAPSGGSAAASAASVGVIPQ